MAGKRFNSLQMIERLVGFDTTSSKSNLALIDFVADYLAGHGVASRRTGDDAGAKANLFATLGPDAAGGIVLSGHSDVVPVAGQAWDSDPFVLRQADGRLYGRGTADMKSFIAVALALVPDMQAAGLRTPLYLAISYDEEVGCFGAERLIADVTRALPLPRIVIIGEPTDMRLVTAHKGVTVFRTTVIGRAAHSAQPHLGANALHAAGSLVHFIETMARDERAAADPANGFEPPYPSFNVGTFSGGTAQNIVANHCSFTWEFRALPGDDGARFLERFNRYAEDEVLPRLRETAPEAAIKTELVVRVPPLAPEPDSPAERLVRALSGANRSEAISFATEGGLFQEAGFSVVVCGPGSIDQAHRPNEFIEVSQVEACEVFLHKLIAWAAAGYAAG
ncbi:MAG: acetylornithine deacetylase [Kiloniellales bacterium]